MSGLSIYAHAFPDQYAFLPQCYTTARPMVPPEYNTLMEYWRHEGWPNQTSWPNMVICWARLQLPNGQRAQSIWSESSSKNPLRQTSCIEVNHLLMVDKKSVVFVDWEYVSCDTFFVHHKYSSMNIV